MQTNVNLSSNHVLLLPLALHFHIQMPLGIVSKIGICRENQNIRSALSQLHRFSDGRRLFGGKQCGSPSGTDTVPPPHGTFRGSAGPKLPTVMQTLVLHHHGPLRWPVSQQKQNTQRLFQPFLLLLLLLFAFLRAGCCVCFVRGDSVGH